MVRTRFARQSRRPCQAGRSRSWFRIRFREGIGGRSGDFTAAWSKFLHDGFVANSAPKPESLTLDAEAVLKAAAEHAALPVLDSDSYEVVFIADAKVDDGRYANNGWLQELPDPITKLTWDNAAWISPAAAERLGLNTDYDGRASKASIAT